jgi:hypothetical protein
LMKSVKPGLVLLECHAGDTKNEEAADTNCCTPSYQ